MAGLISKLQDKGLEAAHLDDVVMAAARALAQNINNAGMKEQISFLKEQCNFTDDEILRALES